MTSEITIDRVEDVAIISPQGDLGPRHEALITQVLNSLIDAETCKVVMDFSDVDHIHYTLLQRLTNIVAFFKDLDGDLRFAEASPYIRKIFQVVTMDYERQVFDSLGEALLSFAEQPVPSQALH